MLTTPCYSLLMGLRQRFDGAISRSGIKNLTELATILGVSGPSISQVLAGQRAGKSLLPRIAEKLGVHERWLRFGDDDVRPAWAIDAETLRALNGVTAYVSAQRAQPTKTDAMLQALQDILAEQRRCGALLERLVKGGAADDQTAQRERFRVPPRPARAPA
jgi:transcriptional regulator with XRE-family HTH domain